MTYDNDLVCRILQAVYEYESVIYSGLRGSFIPLPKQHAEIPDPRKDFGSAMALLHRSVLLLGEESYIEPCQSGWHVYPSRDLSVTQWDDWHFISNGSFFQDCLELAAFASGILQVKVIDGPWMHTLEILSEVDDLELRKKMRAK